ncbi:MAG TPA: serine esterase [Cyanobacteria bacterium UBA8553]|nr:serine esterase [Cyanobacteria bacterium UBA8553]HAJ61114.1 serine esterase [Cyanobacteria bacterium UBA8543]
MLLLQVGKRGDSAATTSTNSGLGDKSLSLKFISTTPTNNQAPAGLIVCLHGFGGNSQQLAHFVPMLNLPEYQLLFPDAPYLHSAGAGARMWYNLRRQDYEGLAVSRQQLTDWLHSLENSTGVPLSRTILSGFSQGGAMTLDVGLTLPLAGLVCISGFLHLTPKLTDQKSFPPVLIVHGKQDRMVPLDEAQSARDKLQALGVVVKYQEFDMEHVVAPSALALMRSFVIDAMAASQVISQHSHQK